MFIDIDMGYVCIFRSGSCLLVQILDLFTGLDPGFVVWIISRVCLLIQIWEALIKCLIVEKQTYVERGAITEVRDFGKIDLKM